MTEKDPAMRIAQRPRGFYILPLPDPQYLPPDDPGYIHPQREPDRDKYLPESLPQHQRDRKHKQEGGDAPDDIDQPEDGLVHPPAEIPGQGAEQHAEGEGDKDGDKPY